MDPRLRSVDQLVEDLGVKHRSRDARRELMRLGPHAGAALKRGLNHDNAAVRIGCCEVLDHYLDAMAIPDLLANVAHDDARVRRWAMHALACDRCKEGECRPGEDESIPLAIQMLREDDNYHVRTEAAALLGRCVHTSSDALTSLQQARTEDPHPLVRKVTGWWLPGGALYERSAPRPSRKSRV